MEPVLPTLTELTGASRELLNIINMYLGQCAQWQAYGSS